MKTAATVSLYLTGVLVLAFAGDISYAAHYAAEATGAPTPPGTWSWTDLAGIAGIAALVLSAISMVLHAIAPRTKTTVDDRMAAFIDEMRRLISTVQPLLPNSKPAAITDDAARRFVAGDQTRAANQTIAPPALSIVDKAVKP